jgi:exopolysaccharide biosynthesis polyprenyl glycosylphosphotransferase
MAARAAARAANDRAESRRASTRRTTTRSVALIASFDTVAATIAALPAYYDDSATLAFPVVVLGVLACTGGFTVGFTLAALDWAPWLVQRVALSALVLAPAALWLGDAEQLLVVALITIPALVLARVLSFMVLRRWRRAGLLDRALIVGAGRVGAQLGDIFLAHRSYGIDPVGYVGSPAVPLPLPVLGAPYDLDRLIRQHRISRLVVAFGSEHESDLVSVLRTAVRRDVEVSIVPRFYENGVLPPGGPTVDTVRGIPLQHVRRSATCRTTFAAKRALDIVVSCALLVLTAPLALAAAVAVRCSSSGPVLFRQCRVGRDGEPFMVAKFRTMRVNGDSDTQWSVGDDDPRLTGVGRLLRRTSIDEIPQLWSVLRGDMSLVGPRPERPRFAKRYAEEVAGYEDRHRFPAGLTGWAQVHGLRGDTSIAERARLDNEYIELWSPWRDIVILVRTVAEVLRSALRR